LNYVGKILDVSYYGADTMIANEREDFLASYEGQSSEVFDTRSVLEVACQDEVTVLNLLRKHFLKPNTIGLIPTDGYSCNANHSKKALIWLVHRERTDGCRISHGRHGREFIMPEYPTQLWTFPATRRTSCTSSTANISMGIPVYLSEMLEHWMGTLCLRDMNKQLQDSYG